MYEAVNGAEGSMMEGTLPEVDALLSAMLPKYFESVFGARLIGT